MQPLHAMVFVKCTHLKYLIKVQHEIGRHEEIVFFFIMEYKYTLYIDGRHSIS